MAEPVAAADALAWAAHLRAVRDAVTTALATGEASLEEVLARRHDPAVAPIHLLTVLEALPGARKVDTRRRLTALGLPGRHAVGDLAEADLAVLAGAFPLPAEVAR
jgi:hypothetical protein